MKAKPRPRKSVPEPKLEPKPEAIDLVEPISPMLPPIVFPPVKAVDEEKSRSRPWTSRAATQMIGRVTSAMHLQRPPPGTSRTFSDPQIDSIVPLYGGVSLDQSQRLSYYDTLSRVLGPAAGVQECIGTYGAYMTQQTQIYYEQLLPGDLAANSTSVPAPPHLQDISNDSPLDFHPQSTWTDYGNLSDSSWDSLSLAISCGDSSSYALDNGFAVAISEQESCLDLKDILASPVLRDHTLPDRSILQQPSRATPVQKTVTFAPTNRALLNFSALLLSAGSGTIAKQSSSSLAGALEEVVPPSPRTAKAEQEARRRSREWSRPRMGRPRAYSAGGGM